MHLTKTIDEEHIGAELCCDICNKQPPWNPKFVAYNWYYLRYSPADVFPSMWICPGCKEDLECEEQNTENARSADRGLPHIHKAKLTNVMIVGDRSGDFELHQA